MLGTSLGIVLGSELASGAEEGNRLGCSEGLEEGT